MSLKNKYFTFFITVSKYGKTRTNNLLVNLSILSDLSSMAVVLSPKLMRRNSLQKGHKERHAKKKVRKRKTHGPFLLKSTVAQPSMKPGSLVNHRITSRMKMVSTANSENFMDPSFLYSSLITLNASLSLSDFTPQPNDCFRLRRKAQNATMLQIVEQIKEMFEAS